ncbi:helicase [Aurantiacibacter xanthus]|uniref:Helicase n=1 Tax=Aurantiacibacter xanthus TaxID=1784712 RepID=A0A3A1P6Q3_9SPHN|nr:DEAD/DEAH box helicase [Aurantiacibacter xanthus]RIV84005.1 helicase [Aurantiacibacter xanthus]|tara:strand:+ start:8093 stop:11404 length:3312 start_codon:yes stop_codon:yes gene_type:complete
MFDATTAALIRAAPPLDGLDLDNLPKRLTEAFADIVSARIRLRGATVEADDEALVATVAELRRIAAAHETYAALLPDRENRASAAFVAASAHQAISLALRGADAPSQVDIAAVSPEVCATLLFLLAEAHADAAEAAKRIVPAPEAGPIERALLLAIRNLAQGRLGEIVGADEPEIDAEGDDFGARALDALRLLLLRGITNLARQLRLRVDVAPEAGGVVPASTLFAQVHALASEPVDGAGAAGETLLSLYPGPLHLANLLLGLDGDLLGSALSRIPTPGGVSDNGWWQTLRRMARQRPYLWRNHREAVAKGYLEQGVSSAISFPTGGGKSTLAELKIATALLRGERVIFLAPTHALVGQTQRSLKRIFQDYSILADVDEDVGIGDVVVLGEVTVMTPERCLMLLSIDPDAFQDLGLIVFDECHLLHPREDDRSRRGLDAMLVILNLTRIAPDADLLLLSAMMKNTQEIADWIAHITSRQCLTLDLSWKPTRQVRGCVVYPAEQIKALKTILDQARTDYPDHNMPPVSVKNALLAQPFGLFSLLQTWSTTARSDYALLQLLGDGRLLSAGRSKGGNWYLTPNGNETSGAIAAAAASAGMKTLVFVQSTVFCEKCVKDYPSRVPTSQITLTEEEQKWRTLAEEEMGGAGYCYMKLAADGTLRAGTASHHALLLREERELHESLFRRPDGIKVLFATSTLAQGMNLPSEVVIISGDSRFDPQADKMQKLEAHELLNAAGRAGRAGEGAQGFVLLVPSKVIDFDDQNNQINGHWMELQAIFEQADQCLVIDDPLKAVLDSIHDGVTQTGASAYLLSKLPLAIAGAEDDPAAVLLNRSFSAYRALAAADADWLSTRVASALAARATLELPEADRWIEQVSSATGLSVALLQQISELLDTGSFSGTAEQVIAALLDWLDAHPSQLLRLLRPESLEEAFGTPYKSLGDDEARGKHALLWLRKLLPIWLSGVPLCELEKAYLGRTTNLKQCKNARHFVSRLVPDLAFMAGLPGQLLAARLRAAGDETPVSTVLATLSGVVREGCDSPDSLAVRLHLTRSVSRVAARKHYDAIRQHIQPGSLNESFEETLERIRNADIVASFDKLDDLNGDS